MSELKALDLLTLKFKLSERGSREVIYTLKETEGSLDSKMEKEFSKRQATFLTKDDKVELVEKTEKSRVDMIKWMFIFWASQLAVIFGLLKVIFLRLVPI